MANTQSIIDFIRGIGLIVHERSLTETTFLPGVAIEKGALVIDFEKLSYPGDILHEAGHLAVTPPVERALLNGDIESGAGEEMAAIAWSYAAALHLNMNPKIVFHEEGYKGGSESLISIFESGGNLGVPLLEWYGMTRYQRSDLPEPDYPKMYRWLRE